MRETKSVEYTLELARHYLEQAKSSIRSVTFPNPDFIKSFDAIADYIYERALIQS
mgnify:FL=1